MWDFHSHACNWNSKAIQAPPFLSTTQLRIAEVSVTVSTHDLCTFNRIKEFPNWFRWKFDLFMLLVAITSQCEIRKTAINSKVDRFTQRNQFLLLLRCYEIVFVQTEFHNAVEKRKNKRCKINFYSRENIQRLFHLKWQRPLTHSWTVIIVNALTHRFFPRCVEYLLYIQTPLYSLRISIL